MWVKHIIRCALRRKPGVRFAVFQEIGKNDATWIGASSDVRKA